MELEELLHEVRANIPTVSVPMASRIMKSVVNEFLARSGAYRHECTVSLSPRVGAYRLSTPAGTRPILLVSAVLGGKTLRITHPRQMDNETPGWRDHTGNPDSCWLDYETIRVTPVPDRVHIMGLRVTVGLGLNRDATSLDTQFAEERCNPIINGTLSRLFTMPGMSWSNPQLGASYGMVYEDGISSAKDRADGNDTAKLRVASYGGY